MIDIAPLIMHREQFPVRVTFANGNEHQQYMIVPPVHPLIVEQGFDLAIVQAVMQKAVRDATKDWRADGLRRERGGTLDGAITEGVLFYQRLPLGHSLAVEPRKLSPWGGDHYIKLDPHGTGFGECVTGWTPELAAEYGVEINQLDRFQRIRGPHGWNYHNIDQNRYLYKNLIIHLNNAVVRAKYAR